jgi:hypothetical protein
MNVTTGRCSITTPTEDGHGLRPLGAIQPGIDAPIRGEQPGESGEEQRCGVRGACDAGSFGWYVLMDFSAVSDLTPVSV